MKTKKPRSLIVCNWIYNILLVAYVILLIKFVFFSVSFNIIRISLVEGNSLTPLIGGGAFAIFMIGLWFVSMSYEEIVSRILFGPSDKEIKEIKESRRIRIKRYNKKIKKLEKKNE